MAQQDDDDKDDPLAREDYFYKQRAYPGTRIPAGARLRALQHFEGMRRNEAARRGSSTLRSAAHAQNAAPDTWTLIGPRPINSGPNPSSGRITAIAVDPRNNEVLYIGAAEGGVWKTTDAGKNWKPLTDDQASLAIGSIAIDPSNPDVIYVGTGEANNSGDSYYGAGILKSTDGGANWITIATPFVGLFGGARIGVIAVHPAKPNIVFAGIGQGAPGLLGVYRSTDAGATWTGVLTGGTASDVVIDPSDPDVMYAALGNSGGGLRNGIYKSTDAGVTWQQLSGAAPNALPTANVGRISLALAPSNTQVLYAGIQTTGSSGPSSSSFGTLLGTYKTTDGGQSWTQLTMPNFCSSQCWYDNVLRVNPANPDIVYAGGVSLYGSLDGGATWRTINGAPNAIHVDHHALTFSADGSRLYDGNDGGVWMTTQVTGYPATWNNLNCGEFRDGTCQATLSIAQFSPGFSIHPADVNITYAGTQDNNTLKYTGGFTWDGVTCGDGGWTVIDAANPGQAYSTCQNIDLRRSPGAGSGAWIPIVNGINQSDTHQFYSPFIGDASNGLRLYFGTNQIYQSSDGGGSWNALSGDLANRRGTITSIAVAPSDSNVVYAGTSNGLVQMTTGATSRDGADWNNRSTDLPNRVVTQIAVHPSDPMTAYVTYSGFVTSAGSPPFKHVFKTANGGISWADISNNLPNVPANDIVIDPDMPGNLYLATDVGVFVSTDDGGSWATLSNGLPRVVVTGLKLHRATRTLRAGTHGRSMWDLLVPLSTASLAPAITKISPVLANAGEAEFEVTLTGVNFVSASVVRWNGAPRFTTFVSGTSLKVNIPATDVAAPGQSSLTVVNPPGFGGTSNAANFNIGPAPAVPVDGIVIATNAGPGPVAPGSIVSVYGSNMASSTTVASSATLPLTLGNASMTLTSPIGNVTFAAPFFFVSPRQVNIQIPWALPTGTAMLRHSVGSFTSPPVPVRVASVAPSLFTTNSAGTGQGSILIAGTTFIPAPEGTFPGSRPAKHGDYIEIYGTGLGPVRNAVATGSPAPANSLIRTVLDPEVTIGGVTVKPEFVQFSGLTPGAVGLYQVNVQVPDSAPAGNAVPVELKINGIAANTVTMAIQ